MAFLPSDILSSIQSADTTTSEIFTNVTDVIQNVGSVWDSITGKSDAAPAASVTALAPTPAPATTPTSAPTDSTTKYALIGLGVLVVLGIFVLRK